MTVDEVVDQIKTDFVSWGTSVAIAALVTAFPSIMNVSLIMTAAKFIVNLILQAIAKEMDFASYFVFKTIQNNMTAATYEDAIRASIAAAQNGDANEIKKARDAQIAAFAAVWILK